MISKQVKGRATIRSGNDRRSSSVKIAVQAFRRGDPVLIHAGRAKSLAFAAETLDRARLRTLRTTRPLHLVLTHARARTLKIRLYTPKIVALKILPDWSAEMLKAIADPTADLDFPMMGPFEALRTRFSPNYPAAVGLAKLASLLPAAVIAGTAARRGTPAVSASDIATYDDEAVKALKLVTRARVPLLGAIETELIAFRPADGGPEHYAIIIGAPVPHEPVLVRLHSECFTGDLLASLKCDCGSQLRGAVEAIGKAGSGIILYLAQEGRGIGLINKLRAYRLQDQGFDTMAANERLGFEVDERRFDIAAKMLELLGYREVRLLTNNPEKLRLLEGAGVRVIERVPHAFPENPFNRDYLRTKAEKAGHLL